MATDIEFYDDKIRLKCHNFGSRTSWTGAHKFLEELRSTFITETGLLPPGLRWVSPAKTFWLFESAPRLQQVVFHYGEADEGHNGKQLYTYTVQLPWTAMLVEINVEYFPIRTWVYALHGPILGHNDDIGVLPLPNHYPCAQVCYPKDANLKASSCHNVADAINLAKEFAWFSFANEDIFDTFKFTLETKMPAFLFVNDEGEWRGDFLDMTDLLASWEDTSAKRILTMSSPYMNPGDSILEPEQLMQTGSLSRIRDVIASATKVEAFNYSHSDYFEEAVRAAHSRSM
jgi:hypothetical protein